MNYLSCKRKVHDFVNHALCVCMELAEFFIEGYGGKHDVHGRKVW